MSDSTAEMTTIAPESDATQQPAETQTSSVALGGLRNLLWRARMPVTVFASLSVFGLQAIHSILLARLLGPTGRGEYGTAVFYAQTMLYIGLIGTHYSVARRAASSDQNPQEIQRSAFRVGLITGVCSMVIAVLLSLIGLPADKQYLLPLCFVCAMLLPAEHLRITAQAVDHGMGRFNRYNLSRVFAATIFPLLVVGLFLAGNRDLRLIAWFTVLVPIVGYGFYWIISDTKNLTGAVSPKPLQLIRDGLPDGVLVLANDLYDRLAILLVVWIATLDQQGLYLTAVPAASLLLVAPNAFELFAFRAAADAERRMTVGQFLKSAGLVVLAQFAVLAALQIILTPLFLVLFGSDFEPGIPVARVLVVAMAFNGLTVVGDGYLRGKKLASVGVFTRIVSVVVMFVAAWLLAAQPPLMRIAMAATLGQIVNALLVGFFVTRVVIRDASDRPQPPKEVTS